MAKVSYWEQALHEAVKMKPGLCLRPQDVGDSRIAKKSCRLCVEPAQEREVCCRQRRWKEFVDLRSVLASDTEMQNWEFVLMILDPVLPHHTPSLLFGTVMDILWHWVLKLSDLLFHFDFTGGYSKEIATSLRRDLELLISVEAVIEYGDFEVGMSAFLHYNLPASLWGSESGTCWFK